MSDYWETSKPPSPSDKHWSCEERAWHATTSNERSIGVEIANIGAYPPAETKILAKWYARDPVGRSRRDSDRSLHHGWVYRSADTIRGGWGQRQ